MNSIEIMNIIYELRKAKGSNQKLVILSRHKDNIYWKKILVAMYDSSINYYISAPDDLTFIDDESLTIEKLFEVITHFSSKRYTGNAARTFALECSQLYGELFRLILGRSLKSGISVKTINKAYPDLIPTFTVMLAKDVSVRSYPMLASTKYDGVRVIAFVNRQGIVYLKTREGKQLVISSLQRSLAGFPNGTYDGELVSGDGKQASRTTITGQVNKCLLGNSFDMENYTFCIFDYLTPTEWNSHNCLTRYGQRLAILQETPVVPEVSIVMQVPVYSDDDTEEMYKKRLKLGYEGLILRSSQGFYEWKRTDKLIKRKATHECRLRCHNITMGMGKYEGMIGSLFCSGIVDEKNVEVNVGDRKSTRLNSSHIPLSRMPSSA